MNIFPAASPWTLCVPGPWTIPWTLPWIHSNWSLSFLVLGDTRLETVLPVWPIKCWNGGRRGHFSRPAGYPLADKAQDGFGHLCYKDTLLPHVQLVVRPFPAKLHPFSCPPGCPVGQAYSVPGAGCSIWLCSTLEDAYSLFFQPAEVPLDVSPAMVCRFERVNSCVVQVINKDTKLYWP